MKILYLFNKIKDAAVTEVRSGRESDTHFFGMFRLAKFGLQADYLELEQFWPERVAAFVRKYVFNIHFVHLPLFFKILKYDVVFTSTAFGCLLLKAILHLKKPVWIMFDFTISGLLRSQAGLRRGLFQYMIRHGADGVITISSREETIMKNLFPAKADKIKYIPLGIDTDFYRPQPSAAEVGTILSVGRDPYRDYGLLIRVMAELDYPLIITTKPGNLDKYQPLPKNITEKNIPTAELLSEYGRASVVVLPLTTKSGTNDAVGCSTLVEAMAMGKAIIATRTFTMESYIRDGENGILVPEGDEAAMKRAIIDLMNDRDKRNRLGVAARRFVVENCDVSKFAGQLAQYFEQFQKYE